MRSLAVCLLLAATPALASPDRPILGGTPTTVGQFPPVVVIAYVDQLGNFLGLCSGTLIAKDWVLTASHCVNAEELQMPNQAAVTASIRVMFNTMVYTSPGETVMASDSIPDAQFDIMAPGHNDAGLIHLATPVTDVTPTPLNFDAAKAQPGLAVTMVGYGVTSGGSSDFGTQRTVQQTAVACSTLTPPPGATLTDANLLCFDQTTGRGKCNGDSGGPSFAMIGGRQVEVGITSFGTPGCVGAGADTRVDAEKEFITSHVKDLYCAGDADCDTGRECFANGCIAQPFGPTGLGSTCATGADCDSGMCSMEKSGLTCTMPCTAGANKRVPVGLLVRDGRRRRDLRAGPRRRRVLRRGRRGRTDRAARRRAGRARVATPA